MLRRNINLEYSLTGVSFVVTEAQNQKNFKFALFSADFENLLHSKRHTP